MTKKKNRESLLQVEFLYQAPIQLKSISMISYVCAIAACRNLMVFPLGKKVTEQIIYARREQLASSNFKQDL